MSDDFDSHTTGLTAPASSALAILPDSGADLAFVTRAIYVGAGGNLAVVMRSGSTVTFLDVPGGTILPIRARRVLAATTAAALVGLA